MCFDVGKSPTHPYLPNFEKNMWTILKNIKFHKKILKYNPDMRKFKNITKNLNNRKYITITLIKTGTFMNCLYD